MAAPMATSVTAPKLSGPATVSSATWSAVFWFTSALTPASLIVSADNAVGLAGGALVAVGAVVGSGVSVGVEVPVFVAVGVDVWVGVGVA